VDTEKHQILNIAMLVGTVNSDLVFSHELFNEAFYDFTVKVKRLSEKSDIIPVTISERLIKNVNTEVGAPIAIEGQYRSYNKIDEGKSKLVLTIFAHEILSIKDPVEIPNSVVLEGFICKAPVYRTTPFSREICDVLLAVNRPYNKSDYIPCIAWGRNARFIKGLKIGDRIQIVGRIQSREYNKRLNETDTVIRVAYEVSIAQVKLAKTIGTVVVETPVASHIITEIAEHKETALTE